MPIGFHRKITNEARKGLARFLGELELAVMDIVWQDEPVAVQDVLAALNRGAERQLAYTTVLTIMSRLAQKGWLVVEKHGRAHHYRATRSRPEAEAWAAGEVTRALIEDFGEIAIAQFVKELDAIAPEQLARLAQLAQEARQDEEHG